MENGKTRRHFFNRTTKVVLLSSILMLGAIITASPGLFSHIVYGQESDADFDGIADIDDYCPDDPQNMCFDSDGDGVADSSSASIQEPAVPEQNFDAGVSVDSDGDGVADSSATDTDSDGVADMDDPCPSDAQDLCIDSDGDGITDVDEKKQYCEEQAKTAGAIADANCAKQVTVQKSGEVGGEIGAEKGGAKGSLSASGGKSITESYDRTNSVQYLSKRLMMPSMQNV